jgi:hypothetical protein
MEEIQIQDLQSQDLQFTRYLYEKDEVKIALLMSLLNKSDESIFWAYELFYSGFKNELVEWIWIIYYDFYYSKNPSFEKYLSNKLNNVTDVFEDKLIALVVNNLLIRPFSLDVFILRKVYSTKIKDNINMEFIYYKEKLELALSEKNYLEIALLILNKINEKYHIEILTLIIEFFISNYELKINLQKDIKEYKKIVKNNNIKNNNIKILLLSRIIYYFSILKNIKLGKSLYVHVDDEDIIMYENITAITKNREFLPYKILANACIYNIDSKNYLSLFHLKRDKQDIKLAYRYNWLYYASYSSLWKNRILKHNGIINDKEKKIIFVDENQEEKFYNEFGYEPDEQKIEVQLKSIQIIKKERTWLSFYNEYKHTCIIDKEISGFKEKYFII